MVYISTFNFQVRISVTVFFFHFFSNEKFSIVVLYLRCEKLFNFLFCATFASTQFSGRVTNALNDGE